MGLFDALFGPDPPPLAPTVAAPRQPTHVAPGKVGSLQPSLDADPRPDLAADHPLWATLLRRSFGADGQDATGCHALLHAIRCEGGRLTKGPSRLIVERGAIATDTWQGYYLPKLKGRGEAIKALLTEARDR